MNQRTKLLGILFGGAVALALLTNVVYPRWIKPLTQLDERTAAAKERLKELQDEAERIKNAAQEYRALVGRAGGFDIDRVATDVRDQINALIEKHKLRADVAPSRPRPDRKTDIVSMTINVKAIGPLNAAIGFLADVYELPQFMRVGNVSIYPGSGGRDERGPTPMNVRIPIEIQVLPQQKIVGRIAKDEIEQPEKLVRHEPRDYAPIWDGTPFDVWIPPVPLRVQIKPSRPSIMEGEKLWLQAHAIGGLGDYSFAWSPSDKVTSPDQIRTEALTTEAGNLKFDVTVTDEKGETATDSVTINVTPARAPVVQRDTRPPPPPPPPPPPDSRWNDRMHRKLIMTLGRTGDDGRLDEMMVSHIRNRTTEFYAVDGEFDGGTLVYVHQTGGLVRRKDDPRNPNGEVGYYVYPIGETLDHDIPVAEAELFPELQRAAALDRQRLGIEPEQNGPNAIGEVQPRGAEEAPVRIGLVRQVADTPSGDADGPDEAEQTGTQGAQRGRAAKGPDERSTRPRGRRPIRSPK